MMWSKLEMESEGMRKVGESKKCSGNRMQEDVFFLLSLSLLQYTFHFAEWSQGIRAQIHLLLNNLLHHSLFQTKFYPSQWMNGSAEKKKGFQGRINIWFAFWQIHSSFRIETNVKKTALSGKSVTRTRICWWRLHKYTESEVKKPQPLV